MNNEAPNTEKAEVELRFLESLLKRIPDDLDILRAVAELYTETGRFQEGLDLDRRISAICPGDSLSWYNLACSLALLGQKDESLEMLSKSIEMGYNDYEWMKKDNDLASLRDDPRFDSLLSWLYGESVEEDEFLF